MRALECFLSTHRCPRRVVWFLILLYSQTAIDGFSFSHLLSLPVCLVVEHWKNGLVPVSEGADNPIPFGTYSS